MFFVDFTALVKIDAVYAFTTLEADMKTAVLQSFIFYVSYIMKEKQTLTCIFCPLN